MNATTWFMRHTPAQRRTMIDWYTQYSGDRFLCRTALEIHTFVRQMVQRMRARIHPLPPMPKDFAVVGTATGRLRSWHPNHYQKLPAGPERAAYRARLSGMGFGMGYGLGAEKLIEALKVTAESLNKAAAAMNRFHAMADSLTGAPKEPQKTK